MIKLKVWWVLIIGIGILVLTEFLTFWWQSNHMTVRIVNESNQHLDAVNLVGQRYRFELGSLDHGKIRSVVIKPRTESDLQLSFDRPGGSRVQFNNFYFTIPSDRTLEIKIDSDFQMTTRYEHRIPGFIVLRAFTALWIFVHSR